MWTITSLKPGSVFCRVLWSTYRYRNLRTLQLPVGQVVKKWNLHVLKKMWNRFSVEIRHIDKQHVWNYKMDEKPHSREGTVWKQFQVMKKMLDYAQNLLQPNRIAVSLLHWKISLVNKKSKMIYSREIVNKHCPADEKWWHDKRQVN